MTGRLCAVYRPRDNIRVYETHGDLLFSGAEQLVRTVDRERDSFDVAILDVSRVDDIDDAARALLADVAAGLRAEGKAGYLVDRRMRHPPAGLRIDLTAGQGHRHPGQVGGRHLERALPVVTSRTSSGSPSSTPKL